MTIYYDSASLNFIECGFRCDLGSVWRITNHHIIQICASDDTGHQTTSSTHRSSAVINPPPVAVTDKPLIHPDHALITNASINYTMIKTKYSDGAIITVKQ